MIQAKATQHAETSLRLLYEAERHLGDGDLYRACENGLEAVNGYLRAGWRRAGLGA